MREVEAMEVERRVRRVRVNTMIRLVVDPFIVFEYLDCLSSEINM
jgi:hypothetical protein